jgi:alcohol dehydrogenase
LLGIDSGFTPVPLRQEVWRRLATDMKPAHLQTMVRTIPFDDLPTVFNDFIESKVRGRIVVDLSA